MAKTFCKYHPRTPARFHCEACEADLCIACRKREGPPPKDICPTCLKELSSLGIANTITPFWERIPRFFAYPAKIDSLLYIGALSIASVLTAFPLPLIAFLVAVAITYLILRYGYIILHHTARGNLDPPGVLTGSPATEKNLPVRQLGIFFVMALMVVAAALVHQALAFAVFLGLLFSVPASVMSLAINGSFPEAVNPAALAQIIGRIGMPYGILYIFLLLLSGGEAAVLQVLEPVLPIWLFFMLGNFISCYFTVIMFNMMGYVVYQYHEELGFEGVREFDTTEDAPPQPAKSSDPFVNELHILLSEGKIDEAKSRLKQRVQADAGEELHAQYHKLLKLNNDKTELARHGGQYVQLLLSSRQSSKAAEIYGDCINADPDFSLNDGRQVYEMAQLVFSSGHYDTALHILNRFAQRFPGHHVIPHAYFLAAKILCENKGQDAQAAKIISGLLKQYPNHDLSTELRSYSEVIRNLQ
ncbi:MAG: hypothetical protein DRQ37_01120 [Gammaproteobacteria bacterium]|nr:MAG: hypothetical protein DRQ37_01120 [Gammaproteobacteria bacterium]